MFILRFICVVKLTCSMELTKKGIKQFASAKHINQLNSNFSRLYSNPKEYDSLRQRTRIDGKLKPIGVKFFEAQNNTPEQIIDETIKIHNRTNFYVACSGGKDSICLSHYIATNYPEHFKGVVFIDTGVGISKTKDWVEQYCKSMNWKLYIIKPKLEEKYLPFTDVYEHLVLNFGFPNAGFHNVVMRRLKYTTFRNFIFDKDKYNHAIISGTRRFESSRRKINTKPISSDGKFFFCSPFFNKTDEYVYKYLLTNGLKITPVHDVLGMSGECMCGCFASLGEREIIKKLDPSLDDYITSLEARILVEGTERAKKSSIWGQGKNKTNNLDKINPNIEAAICGSDCGAGTMRGTENI